jgi:hypothetical protein
MTNDLDPALRARLDRLARAVPVAPERALRPVASVGPRWRRGSSGSGAGALIAVALALIIVFAAAFVGGGSAPSAVMDTRTAGDFRLTLQSPKDYYAAQEPIDVVASLEYIGEDPSIEVYSHPGMPGFGVQEVDGAHRSASPGYRMSCVPYRFRRGEPVTFPFAKSGGMVPGAAEFEFMRDYLNVTDNRPDPVLRLPEGTWRIFAIADFAIGDCGPNHYDLEVEIPVVVEGPEASVRAPSPASPSAATPSPAEPSPVASTTIAPEVTLPPLDVAVPYPEGCAAYDLSARRCAYIVDWARQQAGIDARDPVTIELLGDPARPTGDAASCGIDRAGGMSFVVRVRLTTTAGGVSDHPLFCGMGGQWTLLCTDEPQIQIGSPTMNGYTDVPCSGEAPENPCATPVPTIEPAAAAAAVPLNVVAIDIPIDHVGLYSIPIGQAVLPNGILSEAQFGLIDDEPSDVLLGPEGMFLGIESLDGGQAFKNIYERGWHPGTERVQATLTFTVEWFEDGAVLQVKDVHVR